jgi:hypothetical protein
MVKAIVIQWKDGVEIQFDDVPPVGVRQWLKRDWQFRFSQGVWTRVGELNWGVFLDEIERFQDGIEWGFFVAQDGQLKQARPVYEPGKRRPRLVIEDQQPQSERAVRVREIVNLTPHPLHIAGVVIQPSGQVARVSEVSERCGMLEYGSLQIPVIVKRFGDVEGLPEPQDGVIYIVSALTAQAAWAAGRTDVFCPGDLIRDESGRVVGAASLCAAPQYGQ